MLLNLVKIELMSTTILSSVVIVTVLSFLDNKYLSISLIYFFISFLSDEVSHFLNYS